MSIGKKIIIGIGVTLVTYFLFTLLMISIRLNVAEEKVEKYLSEYENLNKNEYQISKKFDNTQVGDKRYVISVSSNNSSEEQNNYYYDYYNGIVGGISKTNDYVNKPYELKVKEQPKGWLNE